jgi:hypothetical protein
MKLLLIEATKNSPRIELNPNGEMKMKGRCFVEDSYTFFTPVFKCFKTRKFNAVKIEIQLEYLNTSGLVQIYSLLTLFKEIYKPNSISINWFYEEGDEDIFEVGKTIESQIKLPFNFCEYSEAV